MSIRVVVPGQLFSYTDGQSRLVAEGATLGEVLEDLDRRHPGLRFRVIDEHGEIRPHVRFFINHQPALALSRALADGDELLVVGALSGG
ncbi:molybdopterin synthase subunit MoaD [Aromatoleum tolulyticum]|uniref:Molybdopterin synthase subunit MoaD n=1 Tax=Aromatoleum tolulyticum TaxID=34027 RepID=A0A1N7BCP5_9RHOO|nr:MoaD/ThiS family protein [Aromatoleum tolulyticum]SIR49023.1 molybdopterin synthase subunit MoaD [Aromatoleum tolulyticum]